MDFKILEEIENRILKGEEGALVTITESVGSTPRKVGSIMAVFDKDIVGSIGGGIVEFKVINEARELIKVGKSKNFTYGMGPNDELELACGGSVKGFIKVFKVPNKLIVVGAGHIGRELTFIASHLDFEITVLDDRNDYERINGLEVITGDIVANIRALTVTDNTYVVIASRGHRVDLEALREFIKMNVKYIGMVGSKGKVGQVVHKLLEEGVDEQLFKKVYSPVGLNFSDGTPEEIAIEILSEILLIKNNGKLEHRKISLDKLINN